MVGKASDFNIHLYTEICTQKTFTDLIITIYFSSKGFMCHDPMVRKMQQSRRNADMLSKSGKRGNVSIKYLEGEVNIVNFVEFVSFKVQKRDIQCMQYFNG